MKLTPAFASVGQRLGLRGPTTASSGISTTWTHPLRFRSRLIVLVVGLTTLTLGGAFLIVWVTVTTQQERHLDRAVLEAAHVEAAEAESRPDMHFRFSDRPGPAPNGAGPLAKHIVIYDEGDAMVAATSNWKSGPPGASSLGPRSLNTGFDLHLDGEHLRGALVALPHHADLRLLFVVPRHDLDDDEAFLARAMSMVFLAAIAWVALVATWFVRRFTRAHGAITEVARKVADGDLTARIGHVLGDRDNVQLAHDVDEMIGRLADLLNAQRRFIIHAAHELRSPLTVLLGELSSALQHPRDPGAYRRAIFDALESARGLKILAEDLLALARIGSEGPSSSTTISIADVVRDAVRLALGNDQDKIAIEGATESIAVRGARADLGRIVRNLLDNAWAHSPPDGRVGIHIQSAAEHVEIRISDEGPGVAEEDRPHVFEAFYRGARERTGELEGAGLGLAIARSIARAHDGDVDLEPSASNEKGATFLVRLPRAKLP